MPRGALLCPPTYHHPQDVYLVSVNTSKVPGRWLVQLRRPLLTCDPLDLPLPLDVPSFVVWAQGEGAWPSKHTSRGNAQVELGGTGADSAAPPSAAELAASRSVQLTMPAYHINSSEVTQYVCSNFQVPTDVKYQIIQYQVSHTCRTSLGLPWSNEGLPDSDMRGLP